MFVRRAPRVLIALVVAVAAVAGCVSGADPELQVDESGDSPGGQVASQPGPPAEPVEAGAEHASLTGLVVDDEALPIPGASVAVEGPTPGTAKTDGKGRFTFNGLEPGEYVVTARHTTHQAVSKRIGLVLGQVAHLEFQLEVLEIAEAYVDTYPFSGYMQFSVGTPVISPRPGTDNRLSTTHDVGENVRTVVSAMVWESTTAASAKRLRLVVDVDGDAKNDTNGPSPHVNILSEPESKADSFVRHDVLVPVTPCGPANAGACAQDPPYGAVAVVFDQHFDIYVSVFYLDPAPAGYTGLPDEE